MKKLKLFEEFTNENKNVKTTVGEFMTWFGGDGWAEDWQTANSMMAGDKHAQQDGADGINTLKILKELEKEPIEIIIQKPSSGPAYDLSFKLKGINYSVNANNKPFDTDED